MMVNSEEKDRDLHLTPSLPQVILASLIWISVGGGGIFLSIRFLSGSLEYLTFVGSSTLPGFLIWVVITPQPGRVHASRPRREMGIEWFIAVLAPFGVAVTVAGLATNIGPLILLGAALLALACLSWGWRLGDSRSQSRRGHSRLRRWLKDRMIRLAAVTVVVTFALDRNDKPVAILTFVAIFYPLLELYLWWRRWDRRAREHNRSLE